MLKAAATTNKGKLVILGLSARNIELLQKGRPIDVDLGELGLEGRVMIFAGETEATMQAELAELIGPQTKISGFAQ